MEWERVSEFSNDDVDEVLSHLFAGSRVFLAEICDWLMVADRRQQFLADGARDLSEWVSARFGLRHSTAVQLVGVARRLQVLPLLRAKVGVGVLSLDQVDAISRMATPESEAELIGCGRRGWVHGHHIQHWADGGPTNLDNLVLLCGFHHRFLHETDWTIQGHPNHSLNFKKPDGSIYPPVRPELDPRLQQLVRT